MLSQISSAASVMENASAVKVLVCLFRLHSVENEGPNLEHDAAFSQLNAFAAKFSAFVFKLVTIGSAGLWLCLEHNGR